MPILVQTLDEIAHKGAKRQPCFTQNAADGGKSFQRPIPGVGGVFINRPASPVASGFPKALAPSALPLWDIPLSFGSGVERIFGAPAPKILPFPKECAAGLIPEENGKAFPKYCFNGKKAVDVDELVTYMPQRMRRNRQTAQAPTPYLTP